MCNSEGLELPIKCEAGFICDRTGISFPTYPCPPGRYCPEGTNTHKFSYLDSDLKSYYE